MKISTIRVAVIDSGMNSKEIEKERGNLMQTKGINRMIKTIAFLLIVLTFVFPSNISAADWDENESKVSMEKNDDQINLEGDIDLKIEERSNVNKENDTDIVEDEDCIETVEGTQDLADEYIIERKDTKPSLSGSKAGGSWVQGTNGRWRYVHTDGTYTKSDWEKIDGKWYYFNSNGTMRTSSLSDGSCTYYFYSSGQLKK